MDFSGNVLSFSSFTDIKEIRYLSLVTSCFWSSPSWFRSNRLKTSSVLRESSGWFDSSCPWLGTVVWLSIRPLSWASCTTTRHSSSDRKPGISDRNRKKTKVENVKTWFGLGHHMLAIAFEDPNLKMGLSHSHPIYLMAKMFCRDKL